MKTERSSLSAIEMKETDMIVLGRVVAPHGVRGDLRVYPDTDRPEIFSSLPHVYIRGKAMDILQVRPHKHIYIFRLSGIEDRNAAESLVGEAVTMPAGELPLRKEGSYYYFQLIGMQVADEDGVPVGTLSEILETGANDVYVVKSAEGKEICLPAIPSCILSVDTKAGRMTVRLPEWDDSDED